MIDSSRASSQISDGVQLDKDVETLNSPALQIFHSSTLNSEDVEEYQVSISPTFYAIIFWTKARFWRQNFVRKCFVIFGAKILYEKCARKRLMKLTAGVNFTKLLWASFLYKTVLHSSSQLRVWLCNFLVTEYQSKSCSRNVGEIDYRYQFHQHFMSSIFHEIVFDYRQNERLIAHAQFYHQKYFYVNRKRSSFLVLLS